MIPDNTPPHKEVIIPKSKMPALPKDFVEIPDIQGNTRDAIRQYRGPNNIHVLEYNDHWKVHWDWGDPRTIDGALVHIFADAPEIGLALIAGTLAAKKRYDETHSVGESVIEALLAGLFTFGGVVVTKEVFRWLKYFFSDEA